MCISWRYPRDKNNVFLLIGDLTRTHRLTPMPPPHTHTPASEQLDVTSTTINPVAFDTDKVNHLYSRHYHPCLKLRTSIVVTIIH